MKVSARYLKVAEIVPSRKYNKFFSKIYVLRSGLSELAERISSGIFEDIETDRTLINSAIFLKFSLT